MFFERRSYRPEPVATAEELAEKLTQHSWTSCTAFSFDGFLFLNDQSSEDGAGEWAIVLDGLQVESVTFGWMKEIEALGYLMVRLPKLRDNPPMRKPVTVRQHPEGPCRLCA